ncbi:hypothetical protein FQN60_002809, partial [Etheostoma spectabile]
RSRESTVVFGLAGSSLALPVLLGGSAGGVADHVREARPPDQGGARGDDEQALQGRGVAGHVGTAQAPFRDVVYDGHAGTGPAVGVEPAPGLLPDDRRRATG